MGRYIDNHVEKMSLLIGHWRKELLLRESENQGDPQASLTVNGIIERDTHTNNPYLNKMNWNISTT